MYLYEHHALVDSHIKLTQHKDLKLVLGGVCGIWTTGPVIMSNRNTLVALKESAPLSPQWICITLIIWYKYINKMLNSNNILIDTRAGFIVRSTVHGYSDFTADVIFFFYDPPLMRSMNVIMLLSANLVNGSLLSIYEIDTIKEQKNAYRTFAWKTV